MFEFALIIAVILAGFGIWYYYNNKLSAETRKSLENEVKADIKETVAEAKKEVTEAATKVGQKTVKSATKIENKVKTAIKRTRTKKD